jgi:hypothetical protein
MRGIPAVFAAIMLTRCARMSGPLITEFHNPPFNLAVHFRRLLSPMDDASAAAIVPRSTAFQKGVRDHALLRGAVSGDGKRRFCVFCLPDLPHPAKLSP